MSSLAAYPLCWPSGWPRIEPNMRKPAKFGIGKRGYDARTGQWKGQQQISISDGVARVLDELRRLHVSRDDVLISTNIRSRMDGLPRSDQPEPTDPGVAVYWNEVAGAQRVMAIDRYDRVADNLGAIAATLDAMRAIERHGGGQILERAFTGFIALAAPLDPWQKLGVPRNASKDDVIFAFRGKAKRAHPDVPGGSLAAMQELNEAYRACLDAIDSETARKAAAQ